MTLDDKTIYVFVRGDLAEEQQLVQAAHAVFNMTRVNGWPSGEPRIVALDGGSSEKAFAKTQRKIGNAFAYNDFVAYVDPDSPERGVTAIATTPLTKEQALPLANYRLRRYSPSPVASAGLAFDGQGRANSNASVAQTTEHSVSNREVAGEIPAGSSSLNCS